MVCFSSFSASGNVISLLVGNVKLLKLLVVPGSRLAEDAADSTDSGIWVFVVPMLLYW